MPYFGSSRVGSPARPLKTSAVTLGAPPAVNFVGVIPIKIDEKTVIVNQAAPISADRRKTYQ